MRINFRLATFQRGNIITIVIYTEHVRARCIFRLTRDFSETRNRNVLLLFRYSDAVTFPDHQIRRPAKNGFLFRSRHTRQHVVRSALRNIPLTIIENTNDYYRYCVYDRNDVLNVLRFLVVQYLNVVVHDIGRERNCNNFSKFSIHCFVHTGMGHLKCNVKLSINK